jgi:hypothetical protein
MSSDLSSTAGYCSGRERSRRRLTWILYIHGVTADFDEKSIWRERVFGLVYKGEIFELMVQHPTVLNVLEEILGEDAI